jgi:hypothetical protein
MTSPFAALISPPRVPIWRGPVTVQNLMEGRTGAYGKRWTPWTLIEPGVTLPTRGVVAACWALLNQQLGGRA